MRGVASSLSADEAPYGRNHLFKLSFQSKRGDPRVQTLITGELKEHILTTFFDSQATEMALAYIPHPVPGDTRRKEAKATSVKVPLAPWTKRHPSLTTGP